MPTSARRLASTTALCAATLAAPVHADVTVTRGATTIPDGEATAAGDMTIANEKLAFSLAIESGAPWGVPRGAIVDLAAMKDGSADLDRIAFADFIPNNWSAWPNTKQEVEVVEETPERVEIRATRDFGEALIETTYVLEAGSDRVHLTTTMTNNGSEPMEELASGFTLWPDSGYLFAVPGLADQGSGDATGKLADRVTAYDADWFIALHAPYFDRVEYDTKDLYLNHALAPGESRSFEGWLQVGPRGDLAPVMAAEIARDGVEAGKVTGSVNTEAGETVADAVIVVEKDGKPYGWTMASGGKYELSLPKGDYALYATARGYSEAEPQQVSVSADAATDLDFADLKAPGTLDFAVTDAETGDALDARIQITEGQAPLVEFLGRKTFFTELDDRGAAELTVAPGDYVFTVAHGGGFLGTGENVEVTVEPGAEQQLDVALEMLARPNENGWYASDMHHHADQLEGTTPPADLARAELAAGLDLIFVSDHDSLVNLPELQEIADSRGIPFIPSVELSSSWGHFNAYPLTVGETLQIDTATATVQEVFAEARRLGADAIQSNHPFIPYGYLSSLEAGKVPGSFDAGFELLELNGPEDDAKVFERAGQLWSAGHRFYLSGGSDAHDVWNDDSGEIRAYVQVPGEISADGFVAGLKAGHAYVTRGPLIDPDVLFGDTLKLTEGETRDLGFDLTAAGGLKEAVLVGPDGPIETVAFDDAPSTGRAEFTLPETASWVALTVTDQNDKMAFSNPVWIDRVAAADLLAAE